jgi:hypothetical protein
VRAVTVESLGSERNVLFAPGKYGRVNPPDADAVVGADDAAELWTARLSASATVASGAQTDLAVDLRSVHLFDAVTEEALPSAAVRATVAAVA